MRFYEQKQTQPQREASPGITRSSAKPRAANHTAHPILHLQHTVGNQAVQRLLRHNAEAPEPAAVEPKAPAVVHDVLRSPGSPLDPRTREFMESRFGHDFSRVRVHTDDRAAESAAAVNASAYTVGQDIVFGPGQYAPHSEGGRRLLAHELTHTIQQSRGRPATEHNDLKLSDPEGTHEAEADSASTRVMRGERRPRVHSAGGAPVLQRQLITPLGPGGGFGGLMERDRRASAPVPLPPVAPGLNTVKVWINSFIPMANAGPYAGDNREFSNHIHASHRTHQEIEFEAATLRRTIDWKHIGTTHIVVPTPMLPPIPSPAGPWAIMGRPALTPVASATASTDTLTNGPVRVSGNEVLVHFEADAVNPLAPGAPAINLDVNFHINMEQRTATLTGRHDGFPAYEAYVTANGGSGTTVYTYDPRTADEGPSALFPPMDKTVSASPVTF